MEVLIHIRIVERNNKKHCIKLKQKKISCDCGDDVYVGIPCRHLLALFTKEKNFDFSFLNFNERWRIKYFIEPQTEPDPDEDEKLQKDSEDMLFQKENSGVKEKKIEVSLLLKTYIIFLDTKPKKNKRTRKTT